MNGSKCPTGGSALIWCVACTILGRHSLVNRFFLCLASYRFSLADKCSRKSRVCKLSRMSGSSCVLCDATALSLCCAVAVTGTSVESRAQRVQAGARRKHEHGSEFLIRCWRTLHPTVDCRLHGLAGLQALAGGAQPHPPAWAIPAPHSTTAHHSEHFRAVPADCGVFLLVPADSVGWGLPPQATGTGCSKLRYRLGW